MVTSEDGTAYASSGRTGFEADKAFGEDGYWCSVKSPDKPVRLWFQFNEPKRVTKIKFKEIYALASGNGYEVNEISLTRQRQQQQQRQQRQ